MRMDLSETACSSKTSRPPMRRNVRPPPPRELAELAGRERDEDSRRYLFDVAASYQRAADMMAPPLPSSGARKSPPRSEPAGLIFGARSLRLGKPRPFLFKTGAALGVGRRSRIAIGPASRLIDLGKRLRVLPLLLHRLTRRRVWWAIAARNGFQAVNGMPSAPSKQEEQN